MTTFSRIKEDVKIVNSLSGWGSNGVRIKNVNITRHNPLHISATIISDKEVEIETIDKIKYDLEKLVGGEVVFQATIAYER